MPNPRNEAAKRFGFRVVGLGPEDDTGWKLLPVDGRKEYHKAAARIVAKHFDRQLEDGIGRNGRPLIPISEYTYRHRISAMGIADPNAPPLTPAYGLSRTRSFVRYEAEEDGVRVYWRHDPRVRTTWGQILYFHSIGAVNGRKIRDVLGLAPRIITAIKKELQDWWKANRDRLLRKYGIDPRWHGLVQPGRPETRKVVPFDARTIHKDGKIPDHAAGYGARVDVNLDRATFLSGSRRDVEEMRRNRTFSGFYRDFGDRPAGGAFANMQAPRRPPGTPPTAQPAAPRPPRPPRPVRPAAAVAGPALPTYGPSQAPVEFGTDADAARDTLRKIVGRDVTDRDFASLVGAPDGSSVSVYADPFPGNEKVIVLVSGDGFRATRTIRQSADGLAVINNVSIDVEESHQSKGIGRQIFGRQVEQAARLGVTEIRTDAARADGEGAMIGYKVWPRFGYDGPIPDAIRDRLPEPMRGAERLSDLMRTPEGRSWWDENGTTVSLTFDLSPGSLSRSIWETYLRAKMVTRRRRQG
jgi:GNAT superfamily N-acetyltransferase